MPQFCYIRVEFKGHNFHGYVSLMNHLKNLYNFPCGHHINYVCIENSCIGDCKCDVLSFSECIFYDINRAKNQEKMVYYVTFVTSCAIQQLRSFGSHCHCLVKVSSKKLDKPSIKLTIHCLTR